LSLPGNVPLTRAVAHVVTDGERHPLTSYSRLTRIRSWSRSYFTTDGQSVLLCVEPIWDLWPDTILPAGRLLSESCGLVSVGRPVWREDGCAICSALTQWSESCRTHNHTLYCLIWDSPNLEGQVPVFISPRNRLAQLCPRALGSLYITSCDSQGYGGGILTLPQHGGPGPRICIPQEQDGPVQSESHVKTDGHPISTSWCLVHPALDVLHPNKFQSDIRKGRLRWNILCYHWEGCMWSMQCNVEFGYQLSICSGTKKATQNFDWVARPQDLPDANWLLASSPALNIGSRTLVWQIIRREFCDFSSASLDQYINSNSNQAPIAHKIFSVNYSPIILQANAI
jgi:hypothetical protein